jgi:hypothetical protein
VPADGTKMSADRVVRAETEDVRMMAPVFAALLAILVFLMIVGPDGPLGPKGHH